MNAGVFVRTSTIYRLVQRHAIADFTGSTIIKAPPSLRSQTRSRDYIRIPHFVRKRKDFGLSPSSNSSAYSSSSTSASKAGFVGWYLGMIRKRPILTKSATCGVIYIAADLSAQTIAGQYSEGYDLVRTLRMAGYGLIVLGPTLHFWFNFLSRLFPRQDVISTLKKMAMGQTLYGPVMTVVFFSLNAHLQGENSTEIVSRLKRDLLPTMLNGAMYWPACDFITFKFVPVHLQPLVSNAFSYMWTIYITYMASREKAVITAS